MRYQRVVAGVDDSEAGVAAARLGWNLAKMTGAECHLVHVSADVSAMPATLPVSARLDELMEHVQAGARNKITERLAGAIPDDAVEQVRIEMGRAAWVLPNYVRKVKGSLLVLGGKHHLAPTRWFGGSTAHHAVRTLDVPTVIAVPSKPTIERIAVATDLSHASRLVLEEAERLARMFHAELRAIHVVEQIPYYAEYPVIIDHSTFVSWSENRFDDVLKGSLQDPEIDSVVLSGAPANSIAEQVDLWHADLLVVGSHGKS